jgi:hypothetical protein
MNRSLSDFFFNNFDLSDALIYSRLFQFDLEFQFLKSKTKTKLNQFFFNIQITKTIKNNGKTISVNFLTSASLLSFYPLYFSFYQY